MFVNTEMMNSSVPQNQSKNTTQQPNWILRAPNQQPLTDPKLRLFCIPHAGSGAYTYHSWIGRLPDGVELLPIEVPGRNTRRKESPPSSITQFAKDFVDALGPEYLSESTTVPYALFGHSLGAWMSYAIVQELQQRNNLSSSGGGGKKLKFPVALIVSGTRSPKLTGVENDPDGVEMYKLDGPQFWEIFEKRYGKNSDLADPDVREFFRPKLQADFKLGETYRPLDSITAPLPCPLYVSVGASDPRCLKAAVDAWKECCISATESEKSTPGCRVKYFTGGHHYLLNEDESKTEFLNYLSDLLINITEGGGVAVDEEEEIPAVQQIATGGGEGAESVISLSSDAGATVASGSSYLGAGTSRQQRGGTAGGVGHNNGSGVRSRGSLDDGRSERDDLEGHEDGGGGWSWRSTCCCF